MAENKIALIRDGVVENIIVSSLEFAKTLGYDAAVEANGTTAHIGGTWDAVAGFSAPVVPEPGPV